MDAWLTLLRTPSIGPATLRTAVARHGSASTALEALRRGDSPRELDAEARRWLDAPDPARMEADLEWLEHPDHHLLGWDDPDYPSLLREIPGAPAALFVDGDPTLLWMPQVAIVGSRSASEHGLALCRRFARALASAGFTVTSGMADGIDGAAHQAALDADARTIAVLGIATPNFWLAIVLIFVFSVQLRWLPSGRMGGIDHYVLPTITLGTFLVAGLMRLIRSSMLETLDSEFVKLARIKGLRELVVVCKHALRNALIPVLSLWGVFLGGLVTGAIVTETVFAWPGIGRLTYEAVIFRDYPLLQAVIIMDALLILSINLVVDILYTLLDPRVSYD